KIRPRGPSRGLERCSSGARRGRFTSMHVTRATTGSRISLLERAPKSGAPQVTDREETAWDWRSPRQPLYAANVCDSQEAPNDENNRTGGALGRSHRRRGSLCPSLL